MRPHDQERTASGPRDWSAAQNLKRLTTSNPPTESAATRAVDRRLNRQE
jgi:hypothetical protein